MTTGARAPLMASMPRREGRLPLRATIQLSDSCNHACAHCYQLHGQRGEMSAAEVKGVLDDLARSGVLFVTFSGGEVTLRRDFLELLGYARGLRFAVTIYTNAYLVDDALAKRLRDLAVLEVHVSLYSAQPEIHDAVTKVTGSHQRTIAGVRAMRAQGLKVILKMPLMSVNASGIDAFVELAVALGCDYSMDPTIDVREDGNGCTADLRASDAQVRELLRHEPVRGRPPSPPREKGLHETPCLACNSAYISADGTVRPCASLPIALGNVRDEPLALSYEGNRAAEFVRGLTWSEIAGCRDCDLRGYCGRCHAAALLEDGDIFGPSHAACQVARLRFHQVHGSEPVAAEPERGPFRIDASGALRGREYVRSSRDLPAEVLVRAAPRKTSSGAGSGKVRLRVLQPSSTSRVADK